MDKRKTSIGVYFVRLGLICGGALLFLAFYLELEKIRSEPVTSWTETLTADCAVVLTGGPGRVREGFDLLSQKRVKKLIISGVYANAQLREIMPQWPLYGDLNEQDVVLEKRSETTFGNAQQSLAIVEALKCRDVLLVTSRVHMYRSFQTFRGAFPEHITILKHAVVGGSYHPSKSELYLEVLKSLFYSPWAYR